MYELLFHPEAESEIYDLEPIMQAKVLKGLEKLEAKGPELPIQIQALSRMVCLSCV